LGKRKRAQLISATIAELLTELPDVDAAEAKLKAAEATGVEPDTDFLRARSMLSKTKVFHFGRASRYAGGGPVGRRKKPATKKAKKHRYRRKKSRAKSKFKRPLTSNSRK